MAEILVMLCGPLVGVPLPLLPAQILWVNLVTHSLTGTALGSEPVEPDAMSRPPRDPAEGILGAGLLWRLAVLAITIALCGALAAAAVPQPQARSVLMLSLSTAMLGVALGSRVTNARGLHLDRERRPTSPALFIAVGASATLLVAAVTIRPLQELLQTTRPSPFGFASALAAAAVTYAATRLVTRRRDRPPP